MEVTFDPGQTSFEALARYFFQFHDPTIDRSGNGGQYRSAIFYHNEDQYQTAQSLIDHLEARAYLIQTSLEAATTFWPAEARHQKYCDSRSIEPRDHFRVRFENPAT